MARRLGCRGSPRLVRSGTNAVFRAGGPVLRVSATDADVADQVRLANWPADRGVPALRPIDGPIGVDDATVTVWELIDGRREVDYRQLGHAIAAVHGLSSRMRYWRGETSPPAWTPL